MTDRDGGCIWPGCDARPEWCDVAHLFREYHHRGQLTLAAAGLLCRTHHRRFDHGPYHAVIVDNQPVIVRADGTPLDPTVVLPDTLDTTVGRDLQPDHDHRRDRHYPVVPALTATTAPTTAARRDGRSVRPGQPQPPTDPFSSEDRAPYRLTPAGPDPPRRWPGTSRRWLDSSRVPGQRPRGERDPDPPPSVTCTSPTGATTVSCRGEARQLFVSSSSTTVSSGSTQASSQ